ncbi:MAG: DNA-directed RNA polymerase subunit E' [archaeon GW2011_AR3]|nr:MAG: DNA-directed RNA polymerase subunit E' [archaeon GW2011_AR3]
MFYKVQVKDHIRVPPAYFSMEKKDSLIKRIKKKYDGYISKELGFVVDVADIDDMHAGVIIPGDGAAYYQTTFTLLTFKPEMQEVIQGRITDIADFGAFINMGPTDGMIHISQTMDDFVSFSKDKVLVGKDSKRTLKVNDICRARIIATSYKDLSNPKLGMTMRQVGLGRLDWTEEPKKEEVKVESEKKEKKESKKK